MTKLLLLLLLLGGCVTTSNPCSMDGKSGAWVSVALTEGCAAAIEKVGPR